jgi:hypothetical protein
MKSNTNYYTKRGVCYKRGLERVNYGQTGMVKTDASSGSGCCWFVPDGYEGCAMNLNDLHVYTEDIGYNNGTEAE